MSTHQHTACLYPISAGVTACGKNSGRCRFPSIGGEMYWSACCRRNRAPSEERKAKWHTPYVCRPATQPNTSRLVKSPLHCCNNTQILHHQHQITQQAPTHPPPDKSPRPSAPVSPAGWPASPPPPSAPASSQSSEYTPPRPPPGAAASRCGCAASAACVGSTEGPRDGNAGGGVERAGRRDALCRPETFSSTYDTYANNKMCVGGLARRLRAPKPNGEQTRSPNLFRVLETPRVCPFVSVLRLLRGRCRRSIK